MKPGRKVSCRCLQCGHWKSLYISIRRGAAGLPRPFPWPEAIWPAAPVDQRKGSTTASAAAKILIESSSLLQQVVKIAFEQIVVGPIGPRRLLHALGNEHRWGLVD